MLAMHPLELAARDDDFYDVFGDLIRSADRNVARQATRERVPGHALASSTPGAGLRPSHSKPGAGGVDTAFNSNGMEDPMHTIKWCRP